MSFINVRSYFSIDAGFNQMSTIKKTTIMTEVAKLCIN